MKVIINCQEYPDFEFEKKILSVELPGVEIAESRTMDQAEFIRVARGAVVAMVQYISITPRVIDALPECRGYIRNGVGYNNIDTLHAARRGKFVANVPDYCIDEVSNHALAMMLALNRRLRQSMQLVQADAYQFEKVCPVIRLADSTLGIVGLGRIGKALAAKARALVRRIVYYDPYVDTHAFAEKFSTLESLFETADNISLHTPLTEETRGMIGAALLHRIKPHGNLVNTSRGGIVDEPALCEMLRSGRPAGAGMDVFADEPVSRANPFLQLENVIVTPHNAWYSEGAMRDVKISWTRQAIQVARGEPPRHNVFNPIPASIKK
jgi:D-3-phosphoglycerate dehydrogenase